MTRASLLGSLRGMLEIASDDELATLHHLATLLHPASRDERGVVCVVTARLMGKGRENYGPLYTRNDARDFQHEQSTEAIDALIYWAADVIQKSYRPELDSATTTLCRATPATASPNELTPAEAVAPFSSPSLGVLPPSPSSSADSHGDTFLPPPDDRSTAVPHAVSGGGSFTNRLGRACTDCGVRDGESHDSACPWVTRVPPTEVGNG